METLAVRRNQRREIRRAVRMGCRVVDERDFKLVADRMVDISPEGMLIRSDAGLEIGEPLIVSFRATNLGLWFDTEALVTRVVHGRRPFDPGRCFGVHFTTLPAVSRLILRGHFRHIPPPLPRRASPLPRRAPFVDYAADIRRIAGIELH